MLGFTTACLGLLLLALVIAAVQPMGAVRQCRDAITAARVIPMAGGR